MRRRQLLKTVPTAVVGGSIAGCLDGGDSGSTDQDTPTPESTPTESNDNSDGNDGDNKSEYEYWPPSGNRYDVIINVNPGDLRDTSTRLWMDAASKHMPGDIQPQYVNRPGAEGLLAFNDLWQQPGEEGTIGVSEYISQYIYQIAEPNAAHYEMENYRHIKVLYNKLRGVFISHQSPRIEIDDYFQLTWEDFIEKLPELRIGWTGPHQLVPALLIADHSPNLTRDDINAVPFGSGSEVRAEVLKGNIDIYFGGYQGSHKRDDYYYTQFVLIDDRYPDTIEEVKTLDEDIRGTSEFPEEALLHNTSFPKEGAAQVADFSVDASGLAMPPETPDEIYDIYVDAFQAAIDDGSAAKSIEEATGTLAFTYSEAVGQDVQDRVEGLKTVMDEQSETIKELF